MSKKIKIQLAKVSGWEFISPEKPDVVRPIILDCNIEMQKLDTISSKFCSPIMIDGDIIPGHPVLLVISEAMARHLVKNHNAVVVDPGEFNGESRGFVYTSALG